VCCEQIGASESPLVRFCSFASVFGNSGGWAKDGGICSFGFLEADVCLSSAASESRFVFLDSHFRSLRGCRGVFSDLPGFVVQKFKELTGVDSQMRFLVCCVLATNTQLTWRIDEI